MNKELINSDDKDVSFNKLISEAEEKNRIVEMHLQKDPYQKIRSGIKKYEIRLNDEKRRELRKGDIIRFTMLGDESRDCFYAQIVEFKHYESFKSLYEADSDPGDELTLYSCGFEKEISSEDFLKIMGDFYSGAKEEKHGVLVIELKLV